MAVRIVLVGFLCAAAALVLFVVQPASDQPLERSIASPGQAVAVPKTPSPTFQPNGQSDESKPSRNGPTQSDRAWPERRVRAQGLMGRSETWIKPIMEQPHWTAKPRTDTPYRFVNRNGVVLEWAVKYGQVVGATTYFPDNAMSADLTALSEFFVGQAGHFPVHLESMKIQPTRFGQFEAADGRTLYYRAKLRANGPSAYGPSSFEIQIGPFSEQPQQYGPHRDEHAMPMGHVE